MTKEEEFIQSLYDEANEQLKEVYKEQRNNREELLKELAMIVISYAIVDDLLKLTGKDKNKEYSKLSNMILISLKGQGKLQVSVIEGIVTDTVKKTFEFYSYNANFKDVRKIIESNFKGKHFSERVWDNEKEVAKYLHKQVDDFLNGKTNVNHIKKDIEKTFNTSAYNAKRLVETEVNRCEDEAFRRFCRETGVKKVKRNEVLDNRICDECKALDGKVFYLDDAPGVVHPLCRGFNTIEDDKYIEDNSKSDIIKSGALNPYSKEAQTHAKKYYESVRNMKTDIKNISKNVGWKQDSIDKIKEHIFIKEHDLGNNTKERFYPSYDMAQSWQRLIDGKNIKEQDLVLLKHEYLELTLMKKGLSQAEAHIIASEKHNFAKYTK